MSASQLSTNLLTPGFAELSRTGLMYVDYILSHGALLPDVITDASLLAEFERINALEEYARAQFQVASEPVPTVPTFTMLSNMSLRIIDDLLLRGISLPDELTNASLDAVMMNPQQNTGQLSDRSKTIIQSLNALGHPLPSAMTDAGLA